MVDDLWLSCAEVFGLVYFDLSYRIYLVSLIVEVGQTEVVDMTKVVKRARRLMGGLLCQIFDL